MTTSLRFDLVDLLAVTFLITGCILFTIGISSDTSSFQEWLRMFVEEWTPGFIIDGLLLLTVNRIIHRNERNNVLAQIGSLSNDFALDAVRRAGTEGWLPWQEHAGNFERAPAKIISRCADA